MLDLIDLEILSQDELDFWQKKLTGKTDKDSMVMLDDIVQEQKIRNELFYELDLDNQ